MRTMLKDAITSSPTPTPCSRADHVARKRQDRPQAERHGVAPATARIDVDRVGRRAGQLIGHAFLELGEGHEELAFHPAEPHQPE